MKESWSLRGELTLSCSCELFCPCVLSLGNHVPTEGQCQTWAGVRVDEGRFGDVDLAGVKAVVMAEIPGRMSRGNWTVGLFVDSAASTQAAEAMTSIFKGQVGGSTHLLSILVGSFVGTQRVPIGYRTDGETRLVTIDKVIEGAVTPIAGKDKGGHVTIRNSEYWIASDVTVARADKSRLRAFGRNWNFAGRSAEICQINWSNH